MTRSRCLIVLLCVWLGGCAAQLGSVSSLPEADERVSSRPSTTADTADRPAGTHQVEKVDAAKLDSETEQLLDELQERGGLSSKEVSQLRTGLSAASPQTRPLLGRLLTATVTARTQPNKEDAVGELKQSASGSASTPTASANERPASAPSAPATAAKTKLDFQEFFRVHPSNPTRHSHNDVVARVSDLDWDDTDISPEACRSVDRLVTKKSAVVPAAGEFHRDAPLLVPGEREGGVENGGTQERLEQWQDHLHKAIDLLQDELAEMGEGTDEVVRLEAQLRMLHLIADDRSNAARSIKQLAPHEQEFWAHQLHGLALLMDHERIPSSRQRAAAALEQIGTAIAKLSESCTLRLKNLAFCVEVNSYGVFREFAKDVFKPGQEIQIYVEVENFSVEESSQGYETSFAGSYHVFDAMGRPVFDHSFPASSEVCRNRRRDLFVRYRVWLPKQLYPGRYTLELQIEDVKGKRFGQATREFTIAR